MEEVGQASLRLTEACWPVIEFVTNFTRQVKYGTVPEPEQVRYEALAAMRDAEDLMQNDPGSGRAWDERVKGMLVYLLDYKMLNTDWHGTNYWFDNLFETDPMILDHPEALGGEEFFRECDELQKTYEMAEMRDHHNKDILAEQLSLYFICLRLGFKGKFHDRPLELQDYARRLFSRLPAYSTTRAKDMFPEAYKHNQEVKVNYNLGMSLAIVLVILGFVVGLWALTSRLAWNSAVGALNEAAQTMKDSGSQDDQEVPAIDDSTASSQ